MGGFLISLLKLKAFPKPPTIGFYLPILLQGIGSEANAEKLAWSAGPSLLRSATRPTIPNALPPRITCPWFDVVFRPGSLRGRRGRYS